MSDLQEPPHSPGSQPLPSISVVTPSFNQGKYIERTLQSVVDQDYANMEHIVFDGGSTDETVDVLQRFDRHLRYWVSEPDEGQTHAVNKGLKMAAGEIIGWLNSDDVYYPGALHHVAEVFSSHPDINFLYGMADHIDAADRIIEPYYTEEWDYSRLKALCFICQPAVFFRRSVLAQHGLLDESLDYCMDYEYWLRCGAEEQFLYVKRPLAGSRLYPENKTMGSKLQVNEEVTSMLKAKFGEVDQQWIVSLSLAQARSKMNPGKNTVKRLFAALYALGLWQRNLWRINHKLLIRVPRDYLLKIPFIPRWTRSFLPKRRPKKQRQHHN